MERALGLALLALPFVSALAEANVFSIVKPQFSVSVLDDKDYTVVRPATGGAISRSILRQGKVYFSFTVIGADDAIQYLQNNGRLEVDAVIWAGGERRDTIPIGITQQRWGEIGNKLLSEYKEQGFFTWRTYMYTQQTGFSKVEILVRDGVNNVIARNVVSITP